MNFKLKIGGRVREINIDSAGSRPAFSLDGQDIAADVVAVEPNVFSVLIDGEAFEVCVEQNAQGARVIVDGHENTVELDDPRQWRRGARGVSDTEGRQNVFAPMPGKVVRLLVQPGTMVQRGQGLLVVEAMKMQNEIKSPKEGKVERISVREGQPVNAGDVLGVIA